MAGLVDGLVTETRHLMQFFYGQIVGDGEESEKQQDAADHCQDAYAAPGDQGPGQKIDTGYQEEASQHGIDAPPAAFPGEYHQGTYNNEYTKGREKHPGDLCLPSPHFVPTVICHGGSGFSGFLIHILAFPFSLNDFRDAHLVIVRNFDQHADIRHIRSGFPPGNGPAGDMKLLRCVFLGHVLLLAQRLQKRTNFHWIHICTPFHCHPTIRDRLRSTTQSEKCREFRNRTGLSMGKYSLFSSRTDRSGAASGHSSVL